MSVWSKLLCRSDLNSYVGLIWTLVGLSWTLVDLIKYVWPKYVPQISLEQISRFCTRKNKCVLDAFLKIFWWKYVKIYEHISKYIKIYNKISNYIEIYQHIAKQNHIFFYWGGPGAHGPGPGPKKILKTYDELYQNRTRRTNGREGAFSI